MERIDIAKHRELIEKGELEVISKAGLKVRIVCWDRVCWDRKGHDLPILALISIGNKEYSKEVIFPCYSNGVPSGDHMDASTSLWAVSKEDKEKVIEMRKLFFNRTKEKLNLLNSNIWLNNSDGEGEDSQVSRIGMKDSCFGVFVGNNDFFPFVELNSDEIDIVYEAIKEKIAQ